MEGIAAVASVVGIISFVEVCIRVFNRLRNYFTKVPFIIQMILEELQGANLLLKTAEEMMAKFPRDQVIGINNTFTNCENMIFELKRKAEPVQKSTSSTLLDHLSPELELQRAKLNQELVTLKSDLRLLNR